MDWVKDWLENKLRGRAHISEDLDKAVKDYRWAIAPPPLTN